VLRRKTITYIKDEWSNLNTMTIAFKFIMKCEILVWMKAFKALVLAMVFLKHVSMLQLKKKFVKILGFF
jgi:hypothetical protein